MANITYSNSFIDFISRENCKVAMILNQMRYKRYNPKMIVDSEIDYITFRRDGTISYLPAGKEHIYSSDGEWAREGRQNGRPSKVIKKLFHPRVHKYIKDSDFEMFTNQYKAAFSGEGFEFRVRPSSEIGDVYCMERGEGDASLNGSCMNGDKSYLEMYIKCDKLQIVTLEKDDDLYGRALLWDLGNGIMFMDRMYVASDYMYDMFVDECARNKWWRKKHYKTYDHKDLFINGDGDEVNSNFTVFLDTNFDEYPYIDTFQYGDDGSLTNYQCGGKYTYNETGGDRNSEDQEDDHYGQTYDDFAGEWIDEDDAIYIEAGENRFRGRSTHVDNCVETECGTWYHENDSHIVNVNGNWYTKDSDDIVWVESEDNYYESGDVVFCELSDTYELEDNCVFSSKHSTHILKEDAVEVDGEYYHEDDVKKCA